MAATVTRAGAGAGAGAGASAAAAPSAKGKVVPLSSHEIYKSADRVRVTFTTHMPAHAQGRHLIANASGHVSDIETPGCFHKFFCCSCSSCCTADADAAKERGIFYFQTFLVRQYGPQAIKAAEATLDLNLDKLRATKAHLCLADALALQEKTELEYRNQQKERRQQDCYYLSLNPEVETPDDVRMSFISDISHENIRAIVKSIEITREMDDALADKISGEVVHDIQILHSSDQGYHMWDIYSLIVNRFRAHHIQLQKPKCCDYFHNREDIDIWWSYFVDPEETHATLWGIRAFLICARDTFGSATIVASQEDLHLQLKNMPTLSLDQAQRIYVKSKELQLRGDLAYTAHVEKFGILTVHAALGEMGKTVESINRRTVESIDPSKPYVLEPSLLAELTRSCELVKLHASDFEPAVQLIRYHFLIHHVPLNFDSQKPDESKQAMSEEREKMSADVSASPSTSASSSSSSAGAPSLSPLASALSASPSTSASSASSSAGAPPLSPLASASSSSSSASAPSPSPLASASSASSSAGAPSLSPLASASVSSSSGLSASAPPSFPVSVLSLTKGGVAIIYSKEFIKEKLESLPFSILNELRDELDALASVIEGDIATQEMTYIELEIHIVKVVLQREATLRNKSIAAIQREDRLVPEPPLLKKIKGMPVNFEKFISIAFSTPLHLWPCDQLATLYKGMKKGHVRGLTRRSLPSASASSATSPRAGLALQPASLSLVPEEGRVAPTPKGVPQTSSDAGARLVITVDPVA